MSKEYAIGWTIVELKSGARTSVNNFKPIPGNAEDAIRVFKKKIASINKKWLMSCAMASFAYGIFVRLLLA